MEEPSTQTLFDKKYDVIIVGAGIGGLTCASWLSLEGKNVLVLEKNAFIGGRCASYTKRGFVIDFGIHGFCLGEKGPLQDVVRVAKSKLKLHENLLSWGKFHLSLKYKNSLLHPPLPLNCSHFWNLFRIMWNVIRMTGTKWKDKIAIIKTASALLFIRLKNQKPLEKITVKELFERYSNSQVAQTILSGSADCVSVIPNTEYIARDYLDNLFGLLKNGGIKYPKGGCGAIPQAYAQIIKKCGGSILMGQKVEEIVVEEGDLPLHSPKVLGVRLKGNPKPVYSPIVVVNVHFKEFIGNLINKKYFVDSFVKQVSDLETSLSAIVLHLALDTPIFNQEFIMESPMLIEKGTQINKSEAVIGGLFVFPSNVDSTIAPPGKQLVIAALGVDPSRSNEKDSLVSILIDKLQELAPPKFQIREHIEWMDVLSPQDIGTLFGEEGAVVGVASNLKQARQNRLGSDTPVDGLYHCGDDSGLNLWGVGTELAAKSGKECACLILNKKL